MALKFGIVWLLLPASSPSASARHGQTTSFFMLVKACLYLARSARILICDLETPPGKESRLTRAMKAYHREKAQCPEDLPPWLFAEDERKPVKSPSPHHRATQESQSLQRPRGLREIYDAAAIQTQHFTAPANSLRSPPSRTYQDDSGPSKATDRLKALRDAKRNALTGNSVSSYGSETNSRQAEPRPRIGLPSGPRKHY